MTSYEQTNRIGQQDGSYQLRIPFCTAETMPEAVWDGYMIWREDLSTLMVYSQAEGAWQTLDPNAFGGEDVYLQPEPPEEPNVGDLWMDSDDGRKLYVWDGSAWQPVTDSVAQDRLDQLEEDFGNYIPTDGNAPVDAPDFELRPFAVGALEAIIEPVDNDDDVHYEIATSMEPGVAEDGSDTIIRSSATRVPLTETKEGPIPVGQNVYVKIRATDADGAGPWSVEKSGQTTSADAFITAAFIAALEIEARQIVAGNLSANIGVLGALYVGGYTTIDGNDGSITIFADLGHTQPLIVLSPTGSTFRGRVIADDISVLNGLIMRGTASRIDPNSGLTLANGIDADGEVELSWSVPRKPFPANTNNLRRPGCLAWNEDLQEWARLVMPVPVAPWNNTVEVQTLDPDTMAETSRITLDISAFHVQNGFTHYDGHYYLVAVYQPPVGNKRIALRKFDDTTGALVDAWENDLWDYTAATTQSYFPIVNEVYFGYAELNVNMSQTQVRMVLCDQGGVWADDAEAFYLNHHSSAPDFTSDSRVNGASLVRAGDDSTWLQILSIDNYVGLWRLNEPLMGPPVWIMNKLEGDPRDGCVAFGRTTTTPKFMTTIAQSHGPSQSLLLYELWSSTPTRERLIGYVYEKDGQHTAISPLVSTGPLTPEKGGRRLTISLPESVPDGATVTFYHGDREAGNEAETPAWRKFTSPISTTDQQHVYSFITSDPFETPPSTSTITAADPGWIAAAEGGFYVDGNSDGDWPTVLDPMRTQTEIAHTRLDTHDDTIADLGTDLSTLSGQVAGLFVTGSVSITTNASGNATINHSLGRVPAFAIVSTAVSTHRIAVTARTSTTITVNVVTNSTNAVYVGNLSSVNFLVA